jgi:hypothetical protein
VARVAHLVYVPGAHAFLVVHEAFARRMRLAQKIRHEGMHAGRGEKNGGIVLGYKGLARYDGMVLGLKKVQVFLA